MNAVVYQQDKPLLELSAEEWIFPILTPDERFTILFHVKPYRPYSVKKFYDAMVYPKRERIGSELIFKTPDNTETKKFIDQHFLGMEGVVFEDGSTPTIEQQKQWLEDHNEFKVSIFRQGYDGITLAPMANGNGHLAVDEKSASWNEKLTGRLVLFQASDHKVVTQWKMWCPERKESQTLIITHYLSRITQQERHRYNSAISLKENTRRNEQYIQTNWDVVEQLYDSKIKKVEGLLVEGAPCDETNRAGWIPLIPFCMKSLVLSTASAEIEIKNA